MLIGGRDIMMDYPCAKIGDFSFSRFGFYRVDKQNLSHTHTHKHTHTHADDCLTHTTIVSMSKYDKSSNWVENSIMLGL